MFDLTLLRQTSIERYSSTTDSYAIKLSSILCFFVCVSICVSIYDCVLKRVIEGLWVSMIVRLRVHSIRGWLYCDTTYRLMLDWFDTCKTEFHFTFFFRVKCFLQFLNWVAPFSLRIKCLLFFLYHWIWIENYILLKIETCQVFVNSSIIISKYLIWSWNLGTTCSDRISELLRETRDEDETDLTFFDSADTPGIHRI